MTDNIEPPPFDTPTESQSPTATIKDSISPFHAWGLILKHPRTALSGLAHDAHKNKLTTSLLCAAVLGFLLYGLLIGSFSGSEQLFFSPAKFCLGSLAAMLLCIPSLYIFSCLSGADLRFPDTIGIAAAGLAMTSLLLIGLSPAAWIFSVSTQSLSFMAFLHLVCWLIATGIGLNLLTKGVLLLGAKSKPILTIWCFIFITVSLQMGTTLRPLIGRAADPITKEKKFFLTHWFETLDESHSHTDATPQK